MSGPRLGLTESERRRIELIDRLVALGGAGVRELVTGLGDPSWTVRRAVVGALASLGDDAVDPLCIWLVEQRTSERAIAAAVDALAASIGSTVNARAIGLLAHTRPPIAADAANILGRRRATEAVDKLAELVGHEDDNVAVASIEALGAIGGSGAVDALIDVLAQRNFFRTFPAIQVLARLGDPRVVPPLAALLDDETYRIEAARGLGRSGYAQAVAPLASLLRHRGDAIVRLVALALADLVARAEWNGTIDHVDETLRASSFAAATGRFVAALRTADVAERIAIAVALGRVGDSNVVPDLSVLLDDPETRGVATAAIQRIGRAHDDAVLRALESEGPAVHAAVLPVVATARAAGRVRALLASEDSEVRARACEALARIGDTEAVPGLFSMLGDANPRVAHAAAAAIDSLGVSDTVRLAVATLTRDPRGGVRGYALRIIAYLGLAEAYDAVVDAIDDSTARIAELAIGALGAMADPRVDDELARRASDPRAVVRAAVMRAAGLRADSTARRLLAEGIADEAPWVRYYACQGLGRIGDPTTTALIVGRMADAAPHVRVAAIEALAHIDSPEALRVLSQAMRSPDLHERRAALASIALRPRDQALEFLLEGAKSDDITMQLIALGGLRHRPESRALDALVEVARSEEAERRDAALSLLGERDDVAAAERLVELALVADAGTPAHAILSQSGAARVSAIAARLPSVDDRAAEILVASLARMRDETATAVLFEATRFENVAARRAATNALVGLGLITDESSTPS